MNFFKKTLDGILDLLSPGDSQTHNEPPVDISRFQFHRTRQSDVDRASALLRLEDRKIFEVTRRRTGLPDEIDSDLKDVFKDYKTIQSNQGDYPFCLELVSESDSAKWGLNQLCQIGEVEFHGTIFYDLSKQARGCVWECLDGEFGERKLSGFYESIWHFILARDERVATAEAAIEIAT